MENKKNYFLPLATKILVSKSLFSTTKRILIAVYWVLVTKPFSRRMKNKKIIFLPFGRQKFIFRDKKEFSRQRTKILEGDISYILEGFINTFSD